MGTGDLSLELLRQRPDYAIVGLDPSVEMLRRAKRKLSRWNVTFLEGVAEQLPFPDGSFSAVMVSSTPSGDGYLLCCICDLIVYRLRLEFAIFKIENKESLKWHEYCVRMVSC